MCGITGALVLDGGVSPDELRRRTRAMAARLRHRGPDGEGVWADTRMGLGHTRLAVVDLSEHGAQPMVDDTGRGLVLSYNGEIYNHLDLRRELERKGHRFTGHCDTEVLLRGFAEWGTGVVGRLRGMFAFAVWNPAAGTLFLARDRLGQKPLFHVRTTDAFLFGSEIKAILAWPGVPRRADPAALDTYLTLGYTLGTATGFEGIERLPAGHTMTVEADGTARIERYWAPPAPGSALPGSRADWIEEFTGRLTEAIDLRKVADVGVGAFLSGGVDSSAVCALMAPRVPGRLSTFSVGFARDGFDETDAARAVAGHLGTDHHSFSMDDGLLGDLARVVWHYDMPYADSSALVTFGLSREIRRHVTVALSGDGADELLLGYTRYERLAALAAEGGPEDTPLNRRRMSPFPDRPPVLLDAYVHALEKFRERHKMAGYEWALLPLLRTPMSRRLADRFDLGGGAEMAAARLDLGTYLVDDILVKMDIASMAHGLEVRSPFLDHPLVEWIAALPLECRTFDGEAKALLKKTVTPLLPSGIPERPKMGFRVPVGPWLGNELHGPARAFLDSERFAARGLFRPAFVREMLDQHADGIEEHGSRLWALLMLELWFRTFIDADGAAPVPEPFAAGGG